MMSVPVDGVVGMYTGIVLGVGGLAVAGLAVAGVLGFVSPLLPMTGLPLCGG